MPAGNIFVVYVHDDNGTPKPVRFCLNVDATTTVFIIKQALRQQFKVNTWRMNLFFNESPLDDPTMLLEQSGIPHGAHLMLVLDMGDPNPAAAVREFQAVMDVREPYF